MEMTMSAVSVGIAPQTQTSTPSDSSLDTGFSDVLSDVRGSAAIGSQPSGVSSPAEQSNAVADTAEQMSAQMAETALEQAVVAEQSGDTLADALAELVETLTDESGSEQDMVVKALLGILKKMQKNGEADETIDAVMELLASMLGQNVNIQLFQSSSVSVTVPEPSEEVAQITLEQPQTATVQNAVQMTENAVETGVVQLPIQENEVDGETAAPEQKQQSVDFEQPVNEQSSQTALPETAVPTVNAESDAQQLLNELLSQAREELGLTKAEILPKNDSFAENVSNDSLENLPEQSPQIEQSVQNEQNFDTFALRLNHRDSTQELNSIIQTEEQPETSRTEVAPEQAVSPYATLAPETAEIQPLPEEPHQVQAAPPEQQLAEEILSKTETLNGGRTEFTMELNPETLGKITVKLVSAHGRVEVSISAENEETGRLLQSRGENIGNTLRESGIELERYQVVSEREDAQLMQDSYDGSSKNPYSRDDEDNSENQDDGEFLELLSQL